MNQANAASFLGYAIEFPKHYPQECVPPTHSQGGDSGCDVDEHEKTLNIECHVRVGQKILSRFHISDNCPIWQASELCKFIDEQRILVLSGIR